MSIIKKAAGVGSLTFISRLTGYGRDMCVAAALGANIWNDLFILALRLPNLFRSLFGEGAFSNVFVPLFAAQVARHGDDSAFKFAARVQTLLLILLAIFCVLMMYAMPGVVAATTPGLWQQPEAMATATSLARITFPYLLFISLAAFHGGILNAHGNYTIFAFMPVLFNIILIIAVTASAAKDEDAVYLLAWSVLTAGVLELLFMLFFAWRLRQLAGLKWPRWDAQMRRMFTRLGPGVLGSGVAHINLWVDTAIASLVPNAISYLYYADRLNQLPLALVGTALGTVLLPILAKAIARGEREYICKTQNQAFEIAILLSLPAALGLSFLAPEIVTLLLQHGNFNLQAAEQTARALRVISLALPAYVLVKVLLAMFYAHGDTKTPVKLGALCIFINASISMLLLGRLQHVGIAAATVISAWFNCLCLLGIARRRNWHVFGSETLKRIFKLIAASFGMLFLVAGTHFILRRWLFDGLFFLVLADVCSGACGYIGLCFALGGVSMRYLRSLN